jgi:TRAP-type C4-dicarboxylate transport system, small permease component
MKKTLQIFQSIENWIMVLTFATMTIAVFIQVCNRNIMQIPALTGMEEISKYCMIYMVLLGTELGLRDGTQIAVTAIVDKAKGVRKKILRITSKLIVVIFSGAMCYQGLQLVLQQIASGQKSPSFQIPMSIPYAALFISFGVITIVQTSMLILLIKEAPEVEEVENLEDVEGGN